MSSRSEAAYIGGICSLTRGGGINEVELVSLVAVLYITESLLHFLDEDCHKFLSRHSVEEQNSCLCSV